MKTNNYRIKYLYVLVFALFAIFITSNAQLVEISTITNAEFKGANYTDKYDSARFALNDPFSYNPNFPTSDAPGQGWLPDPTTNCFAADLDRTGKLMAWECDFTIEAGTELYALDLWGRKWATVPDGAILGSPYDTRTQDLFLSLRSVDGSIVWNVPGGNWAGVNDPIEGAYGRYIFQTAGVPEEILTNGGHLVIQRTNLSNTRYFHIDELRLVAIIKPVDLGEVPITNPVLNGANYPAKYHIGKYALNDTFSYNPEYPTAAVPLQSWIDGNDTSHCFAKGLSSEISWECDFTITPGKELYALDLWGRKWGTVPNSTILDNQYAIRTQNLLLSLRSNDGSIVWNVPGGSWEGVSNPADGAYGRYIFQTAGVPEEISRNGGHLTISRNFIGTDYFHIDELRLLSSGISNKAPVANAGVDQIALSQDIVTLDGSASTDPNNDTLLYIWRSITDPGIVLSDSTAIEPTFTAPDVLAETNYTFTLVVNDSAFDSQTDEVIIKVFPFGTNFVPVAIVDAPENVKYGGTINLDGSASTDYENATLTYLWRSYTSGLELIDSTSAVISFAAPIVPVDQEFEFSLIVNDGTNDSEEVHFNILIEAENNIPVAFAGIPQTVSTGEEVLLDGTNSYDIDGDELSYSWMSDPSITISDTTSSTPTFIPSRSGNFQFILTVYDNDTNSTPSVIEILVNTPPMANAGENRNVNAGEMVTLDGKGSSDGDNHSLSYYWVSKNPEIFLSDPTSDEPQFVAPSTPGLICKFGLTVHDGVVISEESIVEITINSAPVADAGANKFSFTRELVTLDGSASYDIDGDEITYLWVSKTSPSIVLSDVTSAEPTFTAPDTAGVFQFGLTVQDQMIMSGESIVEIIIEDRSSGIKGLTIGNVVVYPNPVINVLNIESNTEAIVSRIDIIDYSGQLIISKVNINNTIDLSELSSGMYFIVLNYEEGFIIQKLIKK